MKRLGVLILVAALLPSMAQAASGSGSFLVDGPTTVSGGTLTFPPALLFKNASEGLGDVQGTMPAVRVHRYEIWWTEFSAPGTPPVRVEQRTPPPEVVDLTDASLRRVGAPEEGYMALYPAPDAVATLSPVGDVSLEIRRRSEVWTARFAGSEGPDDGPFANYAYSQTVDGPHVFAEAPGALHYEGGGFLKLMGGTFVLSSDEGDRTFSTGTFAEPGVGVRDVVYRWVVLESAAFSLDASATTPWTLAAREVHSKWDGVGTFHPLTGSFRTASSSYDAIGGKARLEGAFASSLAPETRNGVAYGRLLLQGDVVSTTLRPTAVSSSPAGASPAFLLVGLLAVVSSLGVAGGALYRRARAGPALASTPLAIPVPAAGPMLPFTAEDCCDAGTKAASEEDWPAAAKWFARARALAPTSARICGDLAFASSQIGDVDEALRLYAEASRLSSDGEADFNGALAALHGARPLGEVEDWLERALARTPTLVLTLEADDDFRVLEGRPRYERALRGAWERLAGG